MALFRKKTPAVPHQNEVARYSFDDLVALKQEVDGEIQSRQATELDAIKTKIAAIASAFGVSIQELLGFRTAERTRKGKRNVRPKYADPDNPDRTWSGRGKYPRWLKERLDAGASLDDFAIKSNGTERAVESAPTGDA